MEKRIAYRNFVTVCSLLTLSLLGGTMSAQATEIEKWLIMPGPVVEGHATIESDCGACHAPLSEQPQGELCVTCHEGVGQDVGAGVGFHGRLPGSERLECANCHTEHEGRDIDIVNFDPANFDHTLTDFMLLGAHTGVACGDCHKSGQLHREAPSDCVSCHRTHDIHAGSLGEDCGTCHSAKAWTNATFEHGQTRFPLSGAHATVSCENCHLGQNPAEVGHTCNECHSQDDVHKGRNGTQCVDCHSTATWAKLTFNHVAVSGFALLGGHKGLNCTSCHRVDDFSDIGNSECSSCHRKDDPHKGRFGADCGGCHNVFDWDSVLFDHKKKTGFELPSGHRDLACNACHTENLTVALPKDCGSCHAVDDVHVGQLGDRCEVCHMPSSWTARVWFDHDIARFPLIGAHAGVACDQCHATPAYHDADSACVSCHLDDDTHRGSLGDQCDDCHNPANWRAWLFDHGRQTSFALTGAHTELNCSNCHVQSMGGIATMRDDCVSCHRRDDPHSGRFGSDCESCHTTASFSEIEGM